MWTIFCINVGLPIYLSGAIKEAKQDAWISLTLAGFGGFIAIVLATNTAKHFPGQTFIEFSQQVLGKWLGRLVILPYLVYWMVTLGNLLRSTMNFLIMALFQNTPITVIIIVYIIVIAYAVASNGITTLARCAEVLGPLIVLMILCTYFLSVSNLDFNFLLPVVADSGPLRLFRGAFSVIELYADSYLLVMVYGFLNKQERVIPRIYWGYFFAVGLMILTTQFILMTFGPGVSAKMEYPLYELVRYIEVGEFIQRIEVVMIGMWIFSSFIKLGFYLFCLSYGTAQWLGIKKWKRLIVPIAVIAGCGATVISSMLTTRFFLLRYIEPVMLPLLYLLIPLVLWLLITFRKKEQNRTSSDRPEISRGSLWWKWSGAVALMLLTGVYYYTYIRYFRY